jgi:hypothetical protein
MNLNTLIVILTTTILLIVGAVLAYIFYFRQRSRRLKDNFGQEYDRTVEDVGNQKKAEETLEERQKRIEAVQLRELDSDEQEQFRAKWDAIQTKFVDAPGSEVEDADRLVTEVMLARGYPMAQFDKRAENLSVKHPEVVSDYREAHSIADKNRQSQASTEELRQAMLKYRSLVETLLDLQTSDEAEPEMALL